MSSKNLTNYSEEEDDKFENRHVLKWYPFCQYSVIGALFSCLDLSHVFMFITEVKPTNATVKENILQDAIDKLQKETNMDQWMLVTILIGKSQFYLFVNHSKLIY